MKIVKTSVLISCFLILQAASVFAQPQHRMMRQGRSFDRPQSRILAVLKANQEELAITDEQIEKIQNLVYLHKENTIKMNGEQSLSRLELQKLMKDRESLDYDKIKVVLAKTSAIRNEMFIEGLKLRAEIAKILTPEQREALKDMRRTGMRNRTRNLQDRMLQRFPQSRNRIRKQ